MKNRKHTNSHIKILLLLSIILLTSVYFNFLININSPPTNLEDINDDKDGGDDTDFNTIETIKSSAIGEHVWWDPDWPYRILINITNDAGVDLKNYGVWVVFPYGDAEYKDKVNDTLKDIRIIEYTDNEHYYERKYFIFPNYTYYYDPIDEEHSGVYEEGKATIFFNTNISASASITPEMDTYIYFGNMDVESTADTEGLGLIKNGAFDYIPAGDNPIGTPEIEPYSYDPVGWIWSHNVPDDILPWGDIYEDDDSLHPDLYPYSHWQNCLIDDPDNHEKKLGTYSYKWGTNETLMPEAIQDFSRATDNYAGCVYSNSFIVPIIGNGNPSVDKLYLNLWRNIRVVGFDQKKKDVDGYYVRIINASKGIGNPDAHQKLGDYLEIYAGVSNNHPTSELFNFTSGEATNTLKTYIGDLEDSVIFDVSEFMGENVSIEIGMFGDEGDGNKDRGFGQIDELYFTYDLDITIELNEIQTQKSEITVITRDVDNRIVPLAEVSLVQGTSTIKKQTTDSTGKTIFTNLNFGVYNFSVNYKFNSTYEDEVFNSTRDNYDTSKWNMYNVEQLDITFNLTLDIWTIDFEIVDWDGDLLNNGYVKVLDDKDGIKLKKISLVNGTATFRWWNDTRYYYEVYFDNDDYAINNFLLNSSYIYRDNYVQNEKYYYHELDVATLDQGSGNNFKVFERIYTKGSTTDFSTKKLIDFNITLENIVNNLDSLEIYYIDKNDKTDGNLIYQKQYTTEQYDFVSIDIRSVDTNEKLKEENYEVYGILIDVRGYYSVSPSGTIKINTNEATNVYNVTALSKMHIRVVEPGTTNPLEYVSVVINKSTTVITTLTTNSDGWASHDDDVYLPFIYEIGYSYNITLKVYGEEAQLKVVSVDPPQAFPPGEVKTYGYMLQQNSTIVLELHATGAPTQPETQIEGVYDISLATWGIGILHLTVNVSYKTESIDWTLIPEEGEFTCLIQDWDTGLIVLEVPMDANSINGQLKNYSMTIESNELSAGTSLKKYWFIIDGAVSGYLPPLPYYKNVTVIAKETTLSLHNYDTFITVSQYAKEYGEIVKLAVKYYNDPNNPLQDALIAFDWAFGSTKYFDPHPLNNNYYYLSFNTAEAFSASLYPITITASLENYSIQVV
ncbi:MAG: hypothetical protein ACFFAN_09580, partial [Promethearchaeota archaeon]